MDTRFLRSVHAAVRRAVAEGAFLDAYRLADELRARDVRVTLSRRAAADNVIAACAVYGAQVWIDPRNDNAGH